MNVALPLERLPSEIVTLILRSISSPVDIQSHQRITHLVSALPCSSIVHHGTHHTSNRSLIFTEDSEDHLIHIANILPYRLLGHSYKPFARREVDGSFFLVPSDVSSYISWRDHLPMIFELHSQREEANHLIAECAAESWNMLLSEARARSRRDPTFRWHLEFIRPLVLLKTRYPVLSVDFFCLTLGGSACIWWLGSAPR
ncbi:hypothetical protein IWW34DRAFT_713451 [Fusarium oxysporum f. sp. albedinis]|nr:hypothetical protein IWW34DRAFT_713451 [Fusarium oxysporum f. sp. albedinis]KAJ0142639.1 Uncharacterized protein HZ326_14573 [Fusarium oxysporum f. sp. albedinis]